MVKKKRVKKRLNRGIMNKKIDSSKPKTKVEFTINKLLFFVMLSLVSFVLYRFISGDTSEFLNELFFMGAMIFGFVSVGFLIALIILVILKTFPRKTSSNKKIVSKRKRRR